MPSPSSNRTTAGRLAMGAAALAAVAVLLFLVWRKREDNAASAVVRDDPAPTIPSTGLNRPESVARQIEHVDPRRGGWDSEAFAEAAGEQLKQLGKLLAHPDEIDSQHLAPLVDEDCACEPLRPPRLQESFSDACLTVYRVADAEQQAGPVGVDAATALRQLAEPFAGATDVRVKFKLVQVHAQPEAGTTATMAYFQSAGRFAGGAVQQNATWHCRWRAAESAPPKLVSIRVEDYEEIVNRPGAGKWFADCTEAVLSANSSFREQLSYGVDHWRARIDAVVGPNLTAHHGLAVADVDGDGLEDLYVCQGGGIPNRLYRQNADGTARDVSAESGLDWLDSSTCAVFFDVDNDGDQDLVVGTSWGLLLLANDGRGRFQAQTPWTLPDPPAAIAIADYDQDGDLDIYLCVYGSGGIGIEGSDIPFPYQDANNGGPNSLIENRGNWDFVHVTREVGLDENNSRWSLAASWEDYDNDGDLDLYVANDFGRNNLYQYDAETKRFKDVAADAGLEDQASGMSVSWGDFNRDGLMDVYVSNMFSAAGSRITEQPQFQDGASESDIRGFQRLARGKLAVLERRQRHVPRRQRGSGRDAGPLGLGIAVRRSEQRRAGRPVRRQRVRHPGRSGRLVKLLVAAGRVALTSGGSQRARPGPPLPGGLDRADCDAGRRQLVQRARTELLFLEYRGHAVRRRLRRYRPGPDRRRAGAGRARLGTTTATWISGSATAAPRPCGFCATTWTRETTSSRSGSPETPPRAATVTPSAPASSCTLTKPGSRC